MAKRVKVTAQQYADRWEKGLRNSAQKIEESIQSVTESPGQAAAKQKALWLQNIQASADKWATNVAAVTLDAWKQAAITKGIPNLQTAIPLAKGKVESTGGKVISAMNSALANLPPRGTTLEANLNRVAHIARAMRTAFSK